MADRYPPRPSRRTVLAALAAGTASAWGQERWPDRPVKWLVGYPPGGATDVLARLLAGKVGERLGQTVVVENKPGANSNLAAEAVARSTPDGYTFFVGTIASAINMSLYKKVGYDLRKDFLPVALLASSPNVLVVHPGLPVRSIGELIAHARAHPGQLSYASTGSGSSTHLAAELFEKMAKIQITHVPYRGSAPAVTDLIGGQVQLMFDNLPSAWPHVQAGRLRALALTSATRSGLAPDLPTVAEAGLPDFQVEPWFALFAPTGVSADIQTRLAATLRDALQQTDVQSRLRELGATPAKPPAHLGRFIDQEITRWAEVVRVSGASVD